MYLDPKRSVEIERLQHGTLNFRMEKFRILSCLDWLILRLPNRSDEQPAGLMWPATAVSVVHESIRTHLMFAFP